MKAVKPFFDFYINASVHVALAVVSLAIITTFQFGLPVREMLLLYIFFGTVTGYNFVKYASVAGLHHRSLTQSLKVIQVFSFFSFLGLVTSAFFVNIEVLLWSFFFATFTLLYALPIFKGRRNLRSISGLKIFIIAFVWAGVTVVLPVVGTDELYPGPLAPEFLQRFLLVLAWILPFEIRDLKFDLEQLGTIPQRVGVTKTKLFGLLLLVVVLAVEVLFETPEQASIFALSGMCAVTAVMLWKTNEKQSRYFTAFWVEAIPVLWLVLLLLFR